MTECAVMYLFHSSQNYFTGVSVGITLSALPHSTRGYDSGFLHVIWFPEYMSLIQSDTLRCITDNIRFIYYSIFPWKWFSHQKPWAHFSLGQRYLIWLPIVLMVWVFAKLNGIYNQSEVLKDKKMKFFTSDCNHVSYWTWRFTQIISLFEVDWVVVVTRTLI